MGTFGDYLVSSFLGPSFMGNASLSREGVFHLFRAFASASTSCYDSMLKPLPGRINFRTTLGQHFCHGTVPAMNFTRLWSCSQSGDTDFPDTRLNSVSVSFGFPKLNQLCLVLYLHGVQIKAFYLLGFLRGSAPSLTEVYGMGLPIPHDHPKGILFQKQSQCTKY